MNYFESPRSAVLKEVIPFLLSDRTTGKNIIWATKSYESFGEEYAEQNYIEYNLISGEKEGIIQPRTRKSRAEQTLRTKKMAEVFTPLWVCKKMNDACDESFFEREVDLSRRNADYRSIEYPTGKSWLDYIKLRHLEITCGEAPFLVTRYDASTGRRVPIEERVGVLDRKLKMINALAADSEYLPAVTAAYQSTYGYEWQGDNLLIARLNLLYTFADYYIARFGKSPSLRQIKKIANIISWNLLQMDGLTGRVPDFSETKAARKRFEDDPVRQISLFGEEPENKKPPLCVIKDWQTGEEVKYIELAKQ